MIQAKPVLAASPDPLRQWLCITLLAAPLMAWANGSLGAGEQGVDPTHNTSAAAAVPSRVFEVDTADTLQQQSPHGHAWRFWALSAVAEERRAPRSFSASGIVAASPSTVDDELTTPVPEHTSYALMLAALAAIGWFMRHQRQD